MDKLFNKAINFAVDKHKNQTRKQTSWPYAVHLYDVSQILLDNCSDMEVIIAGVLHDTVEDTSATIEEIEDNFGKNIADIVNTLTETKGLPYIERKKLQAIRIKNASIKVKMVKCADCLSNLKSIEHELVYYPNVWEKFNSTKQNIQQHYYDIIQAINVLDGLDMYEQLKIAYYRVFKARLIHQQIINHSYHNQDSLINTADIEKEPIYASIKTSK